jgi:hypothetical protein
MEKLKLEVDALQVSSFETADGAMSSHGTVHGRRAWPPSHCVPCGSTGRYDSDDPEVCGNQTVNDGLETDTTYC